MKKERKKASADEIDMKALKKMAIMRFLMLFPVLGLCFFSPRLDVGVLGGLAVHIDFGDTGRAFRPIPVQE